MDPLGALKLAGDTSLAIAEAAVDRGAAVWATTLTELSLDTAAGPVAVARQLTACDPLCGVLETGPDEAVALEDFSHVLMRKDPPFDAEYVYATYILERVADAGTATAVINDPRGLRDCNEKVYPLRFPDICPPGLVARDAAQVHAFVRRMGGRAVIKPLDMMGGRGVLLLRDDDPNLEALITGATEGGRKRVLVQGFVDAAWEGDKRILLMDGEILGAFVRRPKAGDFRGNLSAGASAHACTLSDADHAICARIVPDLEARGQRFVGIDVIGDRLTEVNVTSPMGLRELDTLHGGRSADRVIDALAH